MYGEKATLEGPERKHYKMILESTQERLWYAQAFVHLLPCPPGFKLDNGSCVCAGTYGGRVFCNQKAQEAKLVKGLWMGVYNDSYYTALCAYFEGYPDAQRLITLPNNSKELNEKLCIHNRTGFMCGECAEGYGPAVNTDYHHYVNCSKTQLASSIAKYVAYIYVPMIAFFTFLIVFDIRLADGAAVAYIIFCQLVLRSFSLDADGLIPLRFFTAHSNTIVSAYKIPYGIFNLKFLEQATPLICFSSTFHALKRLALKYCAAFFPTINIVIVVLFVKLKNYCRTVCHVKEPPKFLRQQERSIGEALLPAFVSFLVLSYSKFANVSMFLVFITPLIDEDGTVHGDKRFVYLAGQYSSTDVEYFPYLALAIFDLCTFVAIPPLLLLDYPLRGLEWIISKSRRLRRIYPMIKIHIFLDHFQGCYKHNMRFFAGLYFLSSLHHVSFAPPCCRD